MSQLTQKDGREERVHVGAFVSREQRDAIFALAERRDRSVSSILRRALAAELERDHSSHQKAMEDAR
jgi:predicted transcriptional regulator